jgi:hypothetical protein
MGYRPFRFRFALEREFVEVFATDGRALVDFVAPGFGVAGLVVEGLASMAGISRGSPGSSTVSLPLLGFEIPARNIRS